jgi:sarcosine oxidase subunit delta
MIRIDCLWCGVRDEVEFTYRGDATVTRPDTGAPEAAFHDFVYKRANPRGWHVEWWYHGAGCRQFLKVVRHTMTHEVRSVVSATAKPEVPAE